MSSMAELRELSKEFKNGKNEDGINYVPEIGGDGQPGTHKRINCLGNKHQTGSFKLSVTPPAGWPNVPGATGSQFKEVAMDWNWCIL